MRTQEQVNQIIVDAEGGLKTDWWCERCQKYVPDNQIASLFDGPRTIHGKCMHDAELRPPDFSLPANFFRMLNLGGTSNAQLRRVQQCRFHSAHPDTPE